MAMNILVTLDANYLHPLRVMLKSLFMNNLNEQFTIYLMHSRLTDEQVDNVKRFIEENGHKMVNLLVDDSMFAEAPTLLHYTKEMYFRLLAYKLLPQDLDRVLYLDPDIIVINPIRELYDTDFDDCVYAAAFHNKIAIRHINKVRFMAYDIDAYFNSGVLLMDLKQLRQEDNEQKIYEFIEESRLKLIMPDQDVLNAVYAKRIKSVDEKLYNYDARYFNYYRQRYDNFDMDKVINETVIIHFCGKRKPWHEKYSGKFHALFKHYEKWANYDMARINTISTFG